MKKISVAIIFVALWLALGWSQTAAESRSHLVMPGETLYSLSNKYQVTQQELIDANPMLKSGLKTGMMLVIPDEKALKKARKEAEKQQKKAEKERKKAEKERMKAERKAGKAISFTDLSNRKEGEPLVVSDDTATYVPTTEDVTIATPSDSVAGPVDSPEKFPTQTYNRRDNYVHLAVVMPFNLQSQTRTDDKQQRRATEFYQGLLIAVNEAQQQGMKVEVSAFDIGTEKTESILANQNFQHADAVIAPIDESDARPFIEYGRQSDVNVICPLVFNEDDLDEPHLFQLNTSKSLLYPQLVADIISRFGDREIVFLTDSSLIARGKEETLVPALKASLQERSIPFHQFTYSDPSRLSNIDAELHLGDKSILFVPTSATKESMRRMFPCLKYLTTATDSTTAHSVAMVGYPEWILYTEEFMNYFYDMNVWMFSKFYANPLDPKVEAFYSSFKYWYGKEPMNLFPKYGLLGYDIATFFIERINTNGWTFDQNIAHQCHEGALQNVMNFERTEQGGWINSALYFVHFNSSTEIEKYVIR